MSVLNIQTAPPAGQTLVTPALPQFIYILTNDTYATVTTTGYLTGYKQEGNNFANNQMALVYTTDEGPVLVKVVITYSDATIQNTVVSLQQLSTPGDVTLPTIASNIIVSTDTVGTLANLSGTAINRGSLQAGLSGTAGTLISYASTAARGSLIVAAVANTGNTNVTISNAAHGQASVISIPDGGQTTSSFLLTNSAGTQTIATGSLALTLGGLTVAAGNIAATLGSLAAGTTVTGGTGVVATTGNVTASAGNLVAGASGAAGSVTSFSGTGSAEFLRLAAVDNAGGNFSTTISNAASVGQSQVVSIPDVGAATGQFLAKTAALVNGNLIQASGTAGLTVDSGVASSAVQLNTGLKAVRSANIGGAGAGPITITQAGVVATSVIVANIVASSNAVTIQKVTPGTGNFDVLFSGDPGATCTLNYIVFIAQQ